MTRSMRRSLRLLLATRVPLLALVLVCALLGSRAAHAQTMLDQEQRLIELHSLLITLTPGNAPGAYEPGRLSVGLELITIPTIDGTTGGKKQITASDRTPVFPRPRVALGLPAPEGFRAYVGLAYIPPVQINDVSSHLGALDAGFAWANGGPFTAGVRGFAVLAQSKSPVTDPNTRDTLDSTEVGADLSIGYRFDVLDLGSVTPFASAGIARIAGDFTVTSDGDVLTSRTTNPSVSGGVRLFAKWGIEATGEVVAYPGRMVHPVFRVAWTPQVW